MTVTTLWYAPTKVGPRLTAHVRLSDHTDGRSFVDVPCSESVYPEGVMMDFLKLGSLAVRLGAESSHSSVSRS